MHEVGVADGHRHVEAVGVPAGVTPESTSPNGISSRSASLPVGAGLVADHDHRRVAVGEPEARPACSAAIGSWGLPAISGRTPEAVATAASSAPAPGTRPVGVGWVGSSLVATRRPDDRATVAVAARRVEVERPGPPDDGRVGPVTVGRRSTPRASSASSTPALGQHLHRLPGLRAARRPPRPSVTRSAGRRRHAEGFQPGQQLVGGRGRVVGGEHHPDAAGPQRGDGPGDVADRLAGQPDDAVEVDDPQGGRGEAPRSTTTVRPRAVHSGVVVGRPRLAARSTFVPFRVRRVEAASWSADSSTREISPDRWERGSSGSGGSGRASGGRARLVLGRGR